MMAGMDWEELWREGVTPWDLGGSSPPLGELLTSGAIKPEGHILVPGCGRGYDLALLAKYYDRVTGVDISQTAVNSALSILPEDLRDGVSIQRGDFFKLTHRYDAVFDYTFFCAIEPAMRDVWAQTMTRIIKPNGLLIAVVFPVIDAPPRDCPPYPVKLEDYADRLRGAFTLIHLNEAPKSHASRRGKEMLAAFRRILE
jgi:cyclopropane fatty-acyl-phospholipid synthase-like methyltransferase